MNRFNEAPTVRIAKDVKNHGFWEAMRVNKAISGGQVAMTKKTRHQLCRRGSIARLESSADLGSRFTMTRLATFGFVGLGSKKRTGQFYVTVERDGEIVFFQEIQHKKRNETQIRKWIAEFNSEAATTE